MNWFYVEAGQQVGPVDDAQLAEMVRSGKINTETLVWREGMANWQTYREAAGPAIATASTPPPQGSPLQTATVAGRAADEAICAECRGTFKKQDMVTFGNSYVCANCKPVFMQRMTEGAQIAPLPGEMRYAGFWIRFAAKFIDGLILGALIMIPAFIIGFSQATSGRPGSAGLILQVIINVGFLVVNLGYTIFFLGKFGATPGKMACKIHVLTSQGAPIGYGRAAGRGFAELLSGIICDIGYIIAAFDKQKRALHDHICDTRVVYK